MLTKDFWIGFFSGAVVGAVGYRLYEQNNGQLQRLLHKPLEPFSSTAGRELSFQSALEATSNIIKKGMESATDATQVVLEKASDAAQAAVDGASKVVKDLTIRSTESQQK
jgi:gas vesicle protein